MTLDTGWEQVMGVLEPFLEETKEARLEQQHAELLQARFDELDQALEAHFARTPRTAEVACRLPQFVDIALMDKVKALADAPSSKTVTQAQFAKIIPAVITQWEAERKQEVISFFLAPNRLQNVSPHVDTLDLAIVLFVCGGPCVSSQGGAVSVLRYPEILSHPCLHPSMELDETDADDVYTRVAITQHADEEDEAHLPFDLARFKSWPGSRQMKYGHHVIRHIVKKLGLDHTSATYSELQECDRRLLCTKCVLEKRQPLAYTWEAAVSTVSSFDAVYD